MKFLHVAFACVVLVCVFVIAAMLVGVGVYFSASRSDMEGISWLKILLLGGFGFWAAAYMSVFAIAFFRKGNLVPDEFLRLLAAVFVVQNIVMFCGFFAEEADLDGRRLKPDLRLVSACLFGSEADWQPARSFTTLLQDHISRGEFQLAWRLSKDILLPVSQNAQIFAWFAVMNGKESALDLERLAEATLAGGKLDAAQSSWLLLARGACFAHRGRIDLAGECFAEAIEHSPDVGTKVAICEFVANLVISARLMDALPEALRLSEFALQLHPEELTLMGTLSSLLVEMGRIDEAEAILERVFRETQSGNDKAICAFYLALVNFRKGNIEAVQSWREKMMQHSPPKWLVARLGELDGRKVAPDKLV